MTDPYQPTNRRRTYRLKGKEHLNITFQEADRQLWAEHPPELLGGQEPTDPTVRHSVASLQ